MNTNATLFDAGELVDRPVRESARVKVTVADDRVTGVAGAALWGPMLDRLNVVDAADARQLRAIGPGGYSGGECLRALVELQLAGGDYLSDRALLSGATQELRGEHRLPSHTTLFRFCDEATDISRVSKTAAVLRTMLARGWAMGAAPTGGMITIDPDATYVETHGPGKQGADRSYKGVAALSPMIGVCGETGDVLGVRLRRGKAQPGRAIAGFIRECVAAIPPPIRESSNLWIRVDSAGYQHEVFTAAEQLGAVFSVSARKYAPVAEAITVLAADPDAVWRPAIDTDEGFEIAETTVLFGRGRAKRFQRVLRLIVRRRPVPDGEQLELGDDNGWRYSGIVTNLPALFAPAEMVEAHHRRRGGIPEDAIRQLKEDFGMNHAPLQNFFGNWLWMLSAAIAHNVARWIRVLALPDEFKRCRGKRLRLAFFNIAARVVHHSRQLWLRIPRSHAWANAFIQALTRIRALPAYA